MTRRLLLASAVVLAAGLAAPPTGGAQIDRLVAECEPLAGQAERLCLQAAQAIEVGRPRVGLALTGANPVPGTASTLGFRLDRVPRVTVGGRANLVRLALPPLDDADRPIEAFLPGFGLNASVAVLPGFAPFPTVGGVGSLDLLGAFGVVPVPARRGLRSQSPTSFGAGARIGLFRESFTLPGASVSVLYHRTNDVAYGDPDLETTNVFFRTGLSTWSVRAAVSKRILTLGATAGVGRDRYAGDVRFGVAAPGPGQQQEFRFDVGDHRHYRSVAFANLSWTTLIVHVVGEAGWQSGGRRVPGLAQQDVRMDPEAGALFASLAVRLSL